MKYCTKCGNEISSGMKFCTKCGEPVTSIEEDNHDSDRKTQRIIESDSKESNIGERSQPKERKRKIIEWLIGIVAAVILVVAAVAGVIILKDGKDEDKKDSEVAATEQEEKGDVKPPSISQEDVSSLFPGWQMMKQEVVNNNGDYYTVLAIAQNEIEHEETLKIAVIDYDKEAEDSKWSGVWESPEYAADPMINMENYIGDFYVVNSENTSMSLVVFNVLHAGTARSYETSAISIDEKGLGEVVWEGNGSFIDEKEDYIEVMVHGAVRLAVKNDEVKITEIPRSEVGSSDALKVEFTLNSDGLVVPVKDEEIYIKKDQPITFVPADNKTKRTFDKGNISLYYSSMDYAPVTTANANLVYAGNQFSFSKEDSYGFLLDYYGDNDTEFHNPPPYTFIVHVGDGVKPVENEEEEETPSFSSEIEAPFPLGTSLNDLREHYGEPTYDGYFMGGKLVSFDDDGYFIDESNETVNGYYFAASTLSVFGATVGMTVDEINEIYSDTAETYLNEVETQDYVHSYRKNGYKIFFHSDEEKEATTYVMVVKE